MADYRIFEPEVSPRGLSLHLKLSNLESPGFYNFEEEPDITTASTHHPLFPLYL